MISPYMPTISTCLQEQLALSSEKMLIPSTFTQMLEKNHKIGNPFPLFSKIDDDRVKELKAMFGGDQVSDSKAAAPLPVAATVGDLQAQIEAQGNLKTIFFFKKDKV